MIEVKNINNILTSIEKKKESIIIALRKGLREGLREYEAYIIRYQLGGRRGNEGVNVVTGVARNSLDVKMKRGKEIAGSIMVGRRAWYLKVHQHLDFDGYIRPKTKKNLVFKTKKGWVITKEVYIPKRLYFYERFKDKGRHLIQKRLNRQLERLSK